MLRKNTLSLGYLYKNPLAIALCLLIDILSSPLVLTRRKSLPENIKNILILKPDHMGDMVLALSAIELIHKRFPEANIHIVHHPQSKQFLKYLSFTPQTYNISHYKLDRSNKPKHRKIFNYLNDLMRTIPTLRKAKIDLAINLRAFGPNMAWLPFCTGANFSVSHGTASCKFFNDLIVSWEENIHEICHHKEVLSAIGIQASTQELAPKITIPSDLLKIQSLRDYNLNKPFTLLHPGAGDLNKIIPPASWKSFLTTQNIADRLLVVGLPKELDGFYQFDFGIPTHFLDDLSIPELLVVINSATNIFCLDSLVMHLSWALDKDTLVTFKTSDPTQWAPISSKIQWRILNDSNLG